METGNYDHSVARLSEKQGVWKPAQPRAPHAPEHDRKLLRGRGNAFNCAFDLGQKPMRQVQCLCLVPLLRVNQLRSSGRREDDLAHLPATLFEFCLKAFPVGTLHATVLKCRQAPLQFLLLRGCDRDLVLVKAIPELRDQRETFVGRQAGDFVGSEFHCSNVAQSLITVNVWRAL